MKEAQNLPILENTTENNQNHYLNRWIYWILLTGGLFTTIVGFFLTLSVLVVIIQQNQIDYTDGLLVSLLLLIGGLILLIGTFIMDRWSPSEPTPPFDDS